ncbi:hypothetical protein U1Q18_036572, partial [Sarracenia purpurea var. burkii]
SERGIEIEREREVGFTWVLSKMKENRLLVAMVSAEGRRSKRAPWSTANGCAGRRKVAPVVGCPERRQ